MSTTSAVDETEPDETSELAAARDRTLNDTEPGRRARGGGGRDRAGVGRGGLDRAPARTGGQGLCGGLEGQEVLVDRLVVGRLRVQRALLVLQIGDRLPDSSSSGPG